MSDVASSLQPQVDGLPPCTVVRKWPSHWSLPSLLTRDDKGKSETILRPPSRFLHAGLKVSVIAGRGRCLLAERALPAGTLVLADAPLMVAATREELVQLACDTARKEEPCLRLLFSLCGDPEDDEARAAAVQKRYVDGRLVERIVRHNYHEVEVPPRDDQAPEEVPPRCGLWPLAAVINHSLHPNVTRCFLGHTVCYRLIKDVSPGEELVDNYIDPRLPREERIAFLARAHGIRDEGPDSFDAPEALFREVQQRLAAAKTSLEGGSPAEGLRAIKSATEFCTASRIRDPGFTDIFWAEADLAAQVPASGSEVRFGSLEAALRHATARERYSSVSCTLALALASCAADAAVEALRTSKGSRSCPKFLAAEKRAASAEAVAREHFAAVYGPDKEIFQLLNPYLCKRLKQSVKAGNEVTLSSVTCCLDAMD